MAMSVVASTKSSKAFDIGGSMTKQGNNVVEAIVNYNEFFINKQS
jgi:hypothetical protein